MVTDSERFIAVSIRASLPEGRVRHLLHVLRQPGTILWTTCLSEHTNQRSESEPELTDSSPELRPLEAVVFFLLAAEKDVQP